MYWYLHKICHMWLNNSQLTASCNALWANTSESVNSLAVSLGFQSSIGPVLDTIWGLRQVSKNYFIQLAMAALIGDCLPEMDAGTMQSLDWGRFDLPLRSIKIKTHASSNSQCFSWLLVALVVRHPTLYWLTSVCLNGNWCIRQSRAVGSAHAPNLTNSIIVALNSSTTC